MKPIELSKVIKAMKTTEQIPGKQTVLQHGLSVRKKLDSIIKSLDKEGALEEQWTPSWLVKYHKEIKENILSTKTLRRYTLWHDLGKPFCFKKEGD